MESKYPDETFHMCRMNLYLCILHMFVDIFSLDIAHVEAKGQHYHQTVFCSLLKMGYCKRKEFLHSPPTPAPPHPPPPTIPPTPFGGVFFPLRVAPLEKICVLFHAKLSWAWNLSC